MLKYQEIQYIDVNKQEASLFRILNKNDGVVVL